jgi:hypothetical protein
LSVTAQQTSSAKGIKMSDPKIDWQKVRERLLVRMGLARPSKDDADFYLRRVAIEASQARLGQRLGDNGWPQRRAEARLQRALLRAVECGALPERSQELQHLLGSYYSVADMLADAIKSPAMRARSGIWPQFRALARIP